ncbi:hypothetical protein [Streptomyces koyangensis]|uniref:hypothetical protein n=1 Tax=Streptomyces koyangensis TaxID=188770 RepID=UPI003C2CA5F5
MRHTHPGPSRVWLDTAADHAPARRMAGAWARCPATGDPGWRPVGDGDGHARVWVTEDGAGGEAATVPRGLWADAGFPVPHP